MKIVELEISNIRGIRHLKLSQNAKNFVIYGPNGSGKSTVVDSIDFLLTGKISRLTGEGTGQISLTKHGSHIDSEPEEAKVRALIKLPDIEEPIELERCMGEPKKLIYDESIKTRLEPLLELAEQGQYILTRRDILRYITANPNTRAQQIQELLKIEDIEKLRQNLVKVRNKFKNDYAYEEKSFNNLKKSIIDFISLEHFDEERIIEFINNNRSELNSTPISSLDYKELKKDISPPKIVSNITKKDLEIYEKNVQEISNTLSSQNQEHIKNLNNKLHNLIIKIKSDPQLLYNLSRLKLTEIGLTLIDETGNCPLCDIDWAEGELEDYLKERVMTIEETKNLQQDIKSLSDKLMTYIKKISEDIQKIKDIMKITNFKDTLLLEKWLKSLSEISTALENPIDHYIDKNSSPQIIKSFFVTEEILDILEKSKSLIKEKVVELTPELLAWDNLTRIEEYLKNYDKNKDTIDLIKKSLQRAEQLLESFLSARDRILGALYEKIKDRFVDLYKEVHSPDEKKFTALLEPKGPGLNFEVDFYGKGIHPPHALHSEGHQDSMGLCLYLALAEEINKTYINIIILDDVIMSVDSDHRKSLCKVLINNFPQWQFLITTHDKTWTNQLKSEGVVDSKSLMEFYNWNMDTGPLYMDYQVEMWDLVYDNLTNRDIPNAAFQLRRGLEQFFGIVCDSLQAPVTFKLSGRYELGDFLKAAIGQFKKLLKMAKSAANSWKNQEKIEELTEDEKIFKEICEWTKAEHWAMNAEVHYNNWPQLTENDFRPVVEAFWQLYQSFICDKCGRMIHLLRDSSLIESSVVCNCSGFYWNLLKKKR